MDTYQRHDLLWINDEGKEYALRHVQSRVPRVEGSEIRRLLFSKPPIPAIVRRQETTEPELISIGFSFPRVIDGIRLRVSSTVPLNCIIRRKTPFDVAQDAKENLSDLAVLAALMEEGGRRHTEIGCFGSAALWLATGLRYRHKNSDMDVFLRHRGNWRDLSLFFQELLGFEKRFAVVIDAEIEYLGQYGIKLKELFSPGKTILGKGLYEVVLLEKIQARAF